MQSRPLVLCVDDDDAIRSVSMRMIESVCDVLPASGGIQALQILAERPDIAVILSDMYMPEMTGLELLGHAGRASPDTIGVLLTGQPDMRIAIQALNQGHIFRFLTKPATVEDLRGTIVAAIAQHRLVSAERVLLEQTLHGSIRALTDALAIVNPHGFGRATRTNELTTGILQALDLPRLWQIEVAAMLSQLGTIILPPETLERASYGRELTSDELLMVERQPEITDQLLAHIPRLEQVRQILREYSGRLRGRWAADRAADDVVGTGIRVLRVAEDFDLLELQGNDADTAVSIMRGRAGLYDTTVIDALARMLGDATGTEVREVTVEGLNSGMVLVDDVVLTTGMLLVSHGATVTVGLVERLKNLPRDSVREPIRVNVARRRAGSGS